MTAGSDAHENALPMPLADGERGDSYRRVLRWFGNIALVADPHGHRSGRAGARDRAATSPCSSCSGTPEGFDVRAVAPSGTTYELGATIPMAEGAMLTIDVPRVRGLDPVLPPPTIRAKVFWIEPGGTVQQLANGDGINTGDGQVNVHLGAPGAYRVEITIVPSHLGPYLGDLGPG